MTRKSMVGLTLLEVMIVIVVMIVLVTLAAPSFRSLILNNRMTAQVDGLFNALNYARSTALSGNVGVVVCPVGLAGSTACGADWSAGWMVVSNPAAAPALLQSSRTAAGGAMLISDPVNGTPAAQVNFDPRGLAGNPAYFKVCDGRGAASARSVQVMPTGFVQTGPTVGQAAWGGALACP